MLDVTCTKTGGSYAFNRLAVVGDGLDYLFIKSAKTAIVPSYTRLITVCCL